MVNFKSSPVRFKLLLFSCCAVLFPSRVTLQPSLWTGKWMEEPDQNKTMDEKEVTERKIKDTNVI